jgi:hypothetical protein
MLILFQPEESKDSLELRIYDTTQDRCFYTALDMIVVNASDIADRLDDFVGLTKKQKTKLVIHDLVQNEQTTELINAFKAI